MVHHEDEDAQLQQALAMSVQAQADSVGMLPTSLAQAGYPAEDALPVQIKGEDDEEASPPAGHANITGAIDRKQLERDRLARQAEKRRLASPSASSSPASSEGRLTKKARIDLASPARGADNPESTPAPPSSTDTLYVNRGGSKTAPASEYPLYPHGTIKKTWAFGKERDKESDITIDEVLQTHHLKQVVLSTWQFDTEWWAKKFDWINGPKQLWIIGAKDEATRESFAQGPKDTPILRVCFTPMEGGANMNHSKFMMLSYPNHLRFVITTANMTRYDWGDTGVMENSVFLIDLPRRPEASQPQEMTFFGKELVHYLAYVGVPGSLIDSLSKFDFSNTKHIALVHSLGGAHTGSNLQRTGFPGLARAVRALNLQTQKPVQLDYATSSIGALRKELLMQLCRAASGLEEEAPVKFDDEVSTDGILDHFRVYFPKKETVLNSTGGTESAGTITFDRKYWDLATFPKKALRDYKSTRTGLLSHNKIMLARGQQAEEDNQVGPSNVAWAYVGSANLTESAWGRLSKDRKTKQVKLSCRNYECGVLIAVPREQVNKEYQPGDAPGIDVFKGIIDVPFEYPSVRHSGKAGALGALGLPWFGK